MRTSLPPSPRLRWAALAYAAGALTLGLLVVREALWLALERPDRRAQGAAP